MNSSKKSNAFFNAPSMTSTVKHGPSQTFLNLGFNDNGKGAAAQNASEAAKAKVEHHSKPAKK